MKKQVEELEAKRLNLEKIVQQQSNCDTCTDYIKNMKSLEFKLSDTIRERDSKISLIKDLR